MRIGFTRSTNRKCNTAFITLLVNPKQNSTNPNGQQIRKKNFKYEKNEKIRFVLYFYTVVLVKIMINL